MWFINRSKRQKERAEVRKSICMLCGKITWLSREEYRKFKSDAELPKLPSSRDRTQYCMVKKAKIEALIKGERPCEQKQWI